MAESSIEFTESSDGVLLDLLNQSGPLGVGELATAMDVTATAIRQRLHRLMGRGLIRREAIREGRGRPHHRYLLTSKGRRAAGSNFDDLTMALWQEIREIKSDEVRTGLLQRLAKRLAAIYGGQITGETVKDRMDAVVTLFSQRNVRFKAEQNQLPVLTAHTCPYPDLAERDRGVCAMEKMLLDELLGSHVTLTDCRLDGATCCRFESN